MEAALVFVVLICLVITGLWLWSLIHCVMNKRLSDTMRIIGIILIVILGLLGSIIYLFLPRENAQPTPRSRRRGGGRTGSRVTRGIDGGQDGARPRSRRGGRSGSRVSRGVEGGQKDASGARPRAKARGRTTKGGRRRR